MENNLLNCNCFGHVEAAAHRLGICNKKNKLITYTTKYKKTNGYLMLSDLNKFYMVITEIISPNIINFFHHEQSCKIALTEKI